LLSLPHGDSKMQSFPRRRTSAADAATTTASANGAAAAAAGPSSSTSRTRTSTAPQHHHHHRVRFFPDDDGGDVDGHDDSSDKKKGSGSAGGGSGSSDDQRQRQQQQLNGIGDDGSNTNNNSSSASASSSAATTSGYYGPLELLSDSFAAWLAVTCIAGACTVLAVLYVTVRPFSHRSYRRLAAQFGASSFVDALALLLPNTRIYLTGDSDVPSPVGTSLMVSNHLVDGDWWALLMLGRCVGLKGSMKVFLRNDYLHMNIEEMPATAAAPPPPPSNGDAGSGGSGSGSSVAAAAAAAALPPTTSATTKPPASNLSRTKKNGISSASHGMNGTSSSSSAAVAAVHHHGSYSSGDGGGGSSSRGTSSSTGRRNYYNPQDLSLLAKLLHQLLEFPIITGEDDANSRDQLQTLLRSFARDGNDAPAVHLLLFPEAWSGHYSSISSSSSSAGVGGGHPVDRRSVLAKSNEFARREGRPQLRHLLLPKSRGFNSSLECLRDSNPVVYDVTMVRAFVFRSSVLYLRYGVRRSFIDSFRSPHRLFSRIFLFIFSSSVQANVGYDGSLPPSVKLSSISLWNILRRKFPREIHVRIKRYSMEEVLQDASWLDKKWAEKDRLLSHFARHNCFPADGRGYCRYRVFNSRQFNLESSFVSLVQLLIMPSAVPVLLLLSIPVFWILFWIWLAVQAFQFLLADPETARRSSSGGGNGAPGDGEEGNDEGQTPGSNSAGTPYLPATPFASPSVTSWRDLFSSAMSTTSSNQPRNGGSPAPP